VEQITFRMSILLSDRAVSLHHPEDKQLCKEKQRSSASVDRDAVVTAIESAKKSQESTPNNVVDGGDQFDEP
jgi:hypothetical protein